MNKKGISPLIGTVLLVAIVIAMVLLIMPWVMKTVKDQQTKTEEAGRQMDCIYELEFELTGSPEKIMVDNRGKTDIQTIDFREYKTNGDVNTLDPLTGSDTEPAVAAYEVKNSGVSCADDTERIEAIATIMSGDKPLKCAMEGATRDYSCF